MTPPRAGRVGSGIAPTNAQMRVSQATSGEWALNVIHNTGTAYGLSVDCSSSTAGDQYIFANYTPEGTGFFVTQRGKVGIGNTNPTRMLDVAVASGAATSVRFVFPIPIILLKVLDSL